MKKGFTLIEIIVVIALLSVIGVGTTVAVIKVNNKKETDILLANENTFNTALEVYLETHSEVLNNVNNKYEGAVITLETLKNEGLINSNLKIDYIDNYYIVSTALLTDKKTLETNVVDEEECDNSIEITRVASWAKEHNQNNVLYFCPKKVVDSCEETETSWTKEDCKKPGYENTLACTIINNAEANATELLNDTEDEESINDMTDISYQTVYREEPLTTPWIDSSSIDIDVDGTPGKEYLDKYYFLTGEEEIKTKETFEVEYELRHFTSNQICYGTDYKIVENRDLNYRNNNELTNALANGLSLTSAIRLKDITYWKSPIIIKNVDCITFPSEAPAKSIEDYEDAFIQLVGGITYLGTIPYEKNANAFTYSSSKLANTPVDFLYKITEVIVNKDENTVKLEYVLIFPEVKIAERTLSKTEDQYGYSYYYRGDIKDNYINFAGMCWRIVRIAGDGSTKIVLDDAFSTCDSDDYKGNFVPDNFNDVSYDGREENEEVINFFSYRANGIANRLKEFQNNKLNIEITENSTYLDYMKSGDWCYADVFDITNNRKTDFPESIAKIECNKMKHDYFDDNTKMYVGTLLAEEVALAGAPKASNTSSVTYSYYLMNHFSKSWSYVDYTNEETERGVRWLTFTPAPSNQIYQVDMNGRLTAVDASQEDFGEIYKGSRNYRPAINLKTNIKITNKTTATDSKPIGTRLNPYEIDFN